MHWLFQLTVLPLLSHLVVQFASRFLVELSGEEPRLWQSRMSVHEQEACVIMTLQNGLWEFVIIYLVGP